MIAIGAFSLFLVLFVAQVFLRGLNATPHLSAVDPLTLSHALPRISLIATARNEERNIEQAARSLLTQDYPNLEIIVVNDRSTDRTGEILERVAREDARLRVKNIRELPAGWLGKCNAMHSAAKLVTGEWIVFTDADVVFEPTALRRAMGYVQKNNIDHLALLPDNQMPGIVLPAFLVHFAMSFLLFVKSWEVRDPTKKAHIGIGAFNMVRTSVYRKIGGHERVRLRPDDDLKLGKVLKLEGGAKQDFLDGRGMISVEWYATVWQLVRGLEKNSFAGVDYRLSLLVFGTLMQFLVFVWPWFGIWVGPILARATCSVAALVLATMYGIQAQRLKVPRKSAFLFPFMALMFLFVIWRATILTLIKGGIEWRGTFYSLRALKQNKV